MEEKTKSNKLPNISLRESEIKKHAEEDLPAYRQECREPIPWSTNEMEALIDSVNKEGQLWSKILEKYKGNFDPSRRIVDLKIKYNLITKKSSYYKTSKKDWITVDENENPILDSLGEIIVISEKFPYDAAKKFGRKRFLNGENNFIMKIREAEDIENVHHYRFEGNDQGRFKLYKLASV